MRYWIVSQTLDNFEITREHGLVGFPHRNRHAAAKMSDGDRIAFYIGRTSIDAGPEGKVQRLRSAATVVGAPFEDATEVWPPRKGDSFAHRAKIRFDEPEQSASAPPMPLTSA